MPHKYNFDATVYALTVQPLKYSYSHRHALKIIMLKGNIEGKIELKNGEMRYIVKAIQIDSFGEEIPYQIDRFIYEIQEEDCFDSIETMAEGMKERLSQYRDKEV